MWVVGSDQFLGAVCSVSLRMSLDHADVPTVDQGSHTTTSPATNHITESGRQALESSPVPYGDCQR